MARGCHVDLYDRNFAKWGNFDRGCSINVDFEKMVDLNRWVGWRWGLPGVLILWTKRRKIGAAAMKTGFLLKNLSLGEAKGCCVALGVSGVTYFMGYVGQNWSSGHEDWSCT